MDDIDFCDPFDMNREEFNKDLWMARYTRECSLPNLLLKKAQVDKEISSFSSDWQNMLYDNHQKFTNATSVVINMKSGFLQMEKEVEALCEKMDDVQMTSSEILENLLPTKSRLTKLLKCRETMKKLLILTDNLEKLLDSGRYTTAARYYLKAKGVLKKYQHLSSLNGILNDCADIVVRIKSGLKNMLNCEIYVKEEIMEALNLLLALGEEPIPLLEHFLGCGKKYLGYILSSLDEIWIEDNDEENEDKEDNAIFGYINSCSGYVGKLTGILEVVKEVFLSQSGFTDEMTVDVLLTNFFKENKMNLSDKMYWHFKEFKFERTNDEVLSQSLDKFVRKCHVCGILTPQINVYYEGMDIVLRICSARCEFQLEKMKGDFSFQVKKLADELFSRQNLHNLLASLKQWVERTLMEVLQSLTHYIQPEFRCCREVTFRKIFCKVLVREGIFVSFFRSVKDELWLLLSSSEEGKKTSRTLLCMATAKFLLHLQHGVPHFLSEVDGNLCSTSNNLSLTSAEEVSAEFEDAVHRTIEFYIQIRSQNITGMIQKSMENKNWLKSNEPSRPRTVIKMICDDIQETKAETEDILGSFGNRAKNKTSGVGNTSLLKSYLASDSTQRNSIEERVLINKIFSESTASDIKVGANALSILHCLLKRILSDFVQYVRLRTFNCFSLQQIQVDICFMQCRISKLIDINGFIQSLFDEIMSSAYNRTYNPRLMNNHVISAICNNAL